MTRLKRWFEGGAVALMQSALLLSFAMSVPLDAEAAPKYAKSEYDCAPNEEYVPWFPWDMTFEKTMLKLMHGYKGECQTPIEIDWAPYQRWSPILGQAGSRIKVESAVHRMLPD